MEDWQLPSELQQLERDLGNRLRGGAAACLRPRILDDLRTRLRAERSKARWQFALAVAVVVLVGMNLSISATQATDFGLRPKGPTESIATIAQQIRQLVPEFSPEEAQRQAILLQAGSSLMCLPDLSGNSDLLNHVNACRLLQPQENHEKKG